MLLAANRNLLKPGGDALIARRKKFASELAAVVTAVGAIDALDQERLPTRLGGGGEE